MQYHHYINIVHVYYNRAILFTKFTYQVVMDIRFVNIICIIKHSIQLHQCKLPEFINEFLKRHAIWNAYVELEVNTNKQYWQQLY